MGLIFVLIRLLAAVDFILSPAAFFIDKGESMNKEEYAKYLMSDHWKQVAKQRLIIDGYRCQFCGTDGTQTNKLGVHHMKYTTLWHENPYTDTVTMCANCHKGIHRVMGRITDENGGRMWDMKTPRVHVYTLTGLDTFEYIEPYNQASGTEGD